LAVAEALLRTGGPKDRVATLVQQAKEDALSVGDEKLLSRITALKL
jgi:hypothetical protein